MKLTSEVESDGKVFLPRYSWTSHLALFLLGALVPGSAVIGHSQGWETFVIVLLSGLFGYFFLTTIMSHVVKVRFGREISFSHLVGWDTEIDYDDLEDLAWNKLVHSEGKISTSGWENMSEFLHILRSQAKAHPDRKVVLPGIRRSAELRERVLITISFVGAIFGAIILALNFPQLSSSLGRDVFAGIFWVMAITIAVVLERLVPKPRPGSDPHLREAFPEDFSKIGSQPARPAAEMTREERYRLAFPDEEGIPAHLLPPAAEEGPGIEEPKCIEEPQDKEEPPRPFVGESIPWEI